MCRLYHFQFAEQRMHCWRRTARSQEIRAHIGRYLLSFFLQTSDPTITQNTIALRSAVRGAARAHRIESASVVASSSSPSSAAVIIDGVVAIVVIGGRCRNARCACVGVGDDVRVVVGLVVGIDARAAQAALAAIRQEVDSAPAERTTSRRVQSACSWLISAWFFCHNSCLHRAANWRANSMRCCECTQTVTIQSVDKVPPHL